MKHQPVWSPARDATSFLAVVLSTGGLQPAFGSRPLRKTAVDFYLRLPTQYFDSAFNSTHERLRWARQSHSVIDTGHGYLHMAGDGAQQAVTVCLFKRPDRTYLVAAGDNEREVFDPILDFYGERQGRLQEFSRDAVLPVRYDSDLNYRLPRYGRTIRVTDTRGA
jgi:hypothetical protein